MSILLALLLAGAQLPENPNRLNYRLITTDSIKATYPIRFNGQSRVDSIPAVIIPASCPLSVDSFIALWDTYKAECWKDSTAEMEGYGNSYVLPVNPPRVVYQNYRKVYRHRPATLDGFMEFLRSRTVNMEHPRRAKEIRDEIWRRANRKEKE
jgi:hypothetical protein